MKKMLMVLLAVFVVYMMIVGSIANMRTNAEFVPIDTANYTVVTNNPRTHWVEWEITDKELQYWVALDGNNPVLLPDKTGKLYLPAFRTAHYWLKDGQRARSSELKITRHRL